MMWAIDGVSLCDGSLGAAGRVRVVRVRARAVAVLLAASRVLSLRTRAR